MAKVGLILAVMSLALTGAIRGFRSADPTLRFRTESGDGPGIEAPAVIQSGPHMLIVRGKLVLPDGCQGLRGHLAPAPDQTLELVIESYRIDRDAGIEWLCPHTLVPTRYEARIAPVEGTWRLHVLYRGTNEATTLADSALEVTARAN